MSSADALTCLAFSPDSQKVASGTARLGVTITRIDSESKYQLKTAARTPFIVAWSPDGEMIMSASLDNTLHCCNAVSSNPIGPPFQGHKELILAASFLRDSSHAISLSRDGELLLWDTGSGEITRQATVSKDARTIFVATLSVDGTLLITSDRKECVAWEIPACTKIADIALPDIPLLQAAIIPNSRQVVLAFGDMSFRIWDTATRDYDSARFDGLGGGAILYAIAVSPSGGLVAVEIDGVHDYPTRFYDRKGQQFSNSNIKCIHPFAFSPDGKRFAASLARPDSKDGFHTLVIYPVEKITGHKSSDILATSALGNREKQRSLPMGFFDESPRDFSSAEGASASRGGVGPSLNFAGQQASPQTIGKRRPLSKIWRRIPRPRSRKTRSTGREVVSGPSTRKRRNPPLSRMWKRIRHPRAHKVGSPEQTIESQEPRPPIVDVPVAKGKRRNISAGQVRIEKEKAKKASAGKSRLSQSSTTQQSVRAAQASPSSKFNVAAPTVSTTQAIGVAPEATTSATSLPNVMISRAGRWTRFWLYVCCASAEYIDGRH